MYSELVSRSWNFSLASAATASYASVAMVSMCSIPFGGDILRHSKSDPMLTSPTSREVMRSQQMAIARRLVSLQACGQQRYLQLRGRHSVEEDFPGQGGQNNRHEQDHEDDKRDEDEEAVEDDVSIAPTIEQIKDDYNSCFSCGVSWSDNHVSLDCKECGGYALTRPCLSCDGQCPSLWTRNLAASHDHRQAQWEGHCVLRRPASQMPRVPQDKRSNGFVRLEATAPINNAMNTSMSALTRSSASISTTTKNATIIPSTATAASSAAVAI